MAALTRKKGTETIYGVIKLAVVANSDNKCPKGCKKIAMSISDKPGPTLHKIAFRPLGMRILVLRDAVITKFAVGSDSLCFDVCTLIIA